MRMVWSVVCGGILLAMCADTIQEDGCHTMSPRGCCKRCNPGYRYVPSGDCGTCLPCPARTYSDKPTTSYTCHICRRCEGIFQYELECSTTRNAICTCIPGKKCADDECSQCENNPCPAGQQLERGACVTCPPGTFNPGSEGTCKPWKSCSAMSVVVNGTSISDVICESRLIKPTRISPTSPVMSSSTNTPKVVPTYGAGIVILVMVPLAFFIILIVATGCYLFFRLEKIKKKFKKIKPTQQEDACSCHYPEEEHGGEEETLSPEP